ncbi:calmodulin-binding protein 60 F-like [Phragmites australis]|uniref:calmodulin-binding protein 60 F-like n=1 Tax=Phragmites australis TaxID=29695 RepID=UPI002D7733B7|nr:calmodulin-binding protein 60 F-like [Phragmites australis]
MVQQPAAKRMKLAVPVGLGGEAASPRSRRLRHTLLVVLFTVRVSVRTTVPASISQIGSMFQGYVDHAFRGCNDMISSKLETLQGLVESKLETLQGQVESKLENLQGQVEGLRHEVRQLTQLCSNRRADQHTKLEPNQEDAAANGSNTSIRLRFLNVLKPPIYTNKDITDENNAAIKVAVFEGDKMITTGPLSKAEIEILVLHGSFYNKCRDNWTEEEFDKHIVLGRNEQGLVLGTVRLINGEVELSQIHFKEGSCRKKIIMAARVCKSKNTAGRVWEAIMEPVEVKDRRNEPNEKSNPPRLYDDVYRLEEIAKDGAYHKRLKEANICTVQDFLKALNKDSNELFKILQMKKKGKSWFKMIGHARECILEDSHELKAYHTEDGNVVLFFNCVHDLVGARCRGNYITCDEFNPLQKASVNKLKNHAYSKLQDIPSNYVMKGNIPEPIYSSTGVAVCPSVLAVGTSQPIFYADHLAAYQGTGPAENIAHDAINNVTGPSYPNANYYPMSTVPLNLTTHFYQDQGIPELGQQQMVSPFIGLDWQQNPQGPQDSPDPVELASRMFGDPSGASTSAQLNHEPPHHLPQLHQMAPAAAPAWLTVAAQPSCAEHEQGPSWSTFPGSAHGNNC